MTSNNNTIIFKNRLNSGSIRNKVNIDGGDNNTIINETHTKAKKIILDLRNAKIKGKNNKIINKFNAPRNTEIKVVLNKNPKIKVSLKPRKG